MTDNNQPKLAHKNIKIHISDDIKNASDGFRLGLISLYVDSINASTIEIELKKAEEFIKTIYDNSSLKSRHSILETRNTYKKLGKDPNRYRPSAEQLSRRVISHGAIYRVNPIVDMGNIISLRTGFSIGIFDADKICGDIELVKGLSDDEFVGIGRGKINVEGLPLYKDNIGAFATPTTDEERTKILQTSKNLFIFINEFGHNNNNYELDDAISFAMELIKKNCSVSDITYSIIQ